MIFQTFLFHQYKSVCCIHLLSHLQDMRGPGVHIFSMSWVSQTEGGKKRSKKAARFRFWHACCHNDSTALQSRRQQGIVTERKQPSAWPARQGRAVLTTETHGTHREVELLLPTALPRQDRGSQTAVQGIVQGVWWFWAGLVREEMVWITFGRQIHAGKVVKQCCFISRILGLV